MKKPKIYIHRAEDWYKLYLNDADIEKLSRYAQVITDGERMEPLSEAELIERLDGVEVIFSLNGKGVEDFTPHVLEHAKKTVKLVCIAHWWNIHNSFVPLCRKAGIEVYEGTNLNTKAVAEWTFSAIFSGIRKLPEFNRRMKNGVSWGEPRHEAGMVTGSTIGLVGLGRIGRYVAHYAKMFGARVIAFDAMPAVDIRALGIEPVSLNEIFEVSDAISLHLPVNKYTTGLIGAEQFNKMKDGAVFINSARAALYDEEVLIEQLKQNRFYAYLDVFENEPLPLNSPLRQLDNVILTPHIAGDNLVMFKLIGTDSVQSICEYLQGGTFYNKQFAL